MVNNTISALQQYTSGMIRTLADTVTTTFLFGCLTVLSLVSASHLVRRGQRRRSTAFMLASIFILYVSTATDFALKITHIVARGQLLKDGLALLQSTSSTATDVDLSHFGPQARTISYIMGALSVINITLGDIVVWWRVWSLCQKRSIAIMGLVFIGGTFVLGTLSAIHFHVDIRVQPLLSLGDIYGGMSVLFSFISNTIATGLIGRKAWEHRKFLRQCPGASKGRWNTPSMRVLILLVESGSIYSLLFFAALVSNIMQRFQSHLPPSALEYLSISNVFFAGCFVPILAIYPTLIIFIVALNWSEIEHSFANATPSDISTDLLPNILLRGNPTTTSLSPNTGNHPPFIGHLVRDSSEDLPSS